MKNSNFSKHAQRELKKNPNVSSVSSAKVSFTEDFQKKIADKIRLGEDPVPLFKECGLSVRILGKGRVAGLVSTVRSKYELQDAPKRKAGPHKKNKVVPTAAEIRQKHLDDAIQFCDQLLEDPLANLGLQPTESVDTLHFAAIHKTFEEKKHVIVKDLCAHYNYSYTTYYSYIKTLAPKQSSFVNILNPHNH